LQGSLSEEVQTLLVAKTRGNPFYVQQVALYCVEHEVIMRRGPQWQLVSELQTVPATIQAVAIARIDRLAWHIREVVKVAAVLGQDFEVPVLVTVMQ
jgi:predicted ATPase